MLGGELLDQRRRTEHRDADVHARAVLVGERLADQRLDRVDPRRHLFHLVQLVAAVTEDELGLDVDERLRRELLVRTVLRLLVIVVELAVGAGAVRGDEREQRIPREAEVHVVPRRRVAGEADGALEAALAQARLDMVADVLDAQPGPVDRLEQVRGELLVGRKRRAACDRLGTRLAAGGHRHRQRPARSCRTCRTPRRSRLTSSSSENASAMATTSGSSTAGVEYV